MMNYVIKRQVFETTNPATLPSAILEWLAQQFEELVPVGTKALRYRGEYGGFQVSYSYYSGVYTINISAVYNLTDSTSESAGSVGYNTTSVTVENKAVHKIGITVVKSDDYMIIIPGNHTFTAYASDAPVVKYVTSKLRGKFLGIGRITNMALSLNLLPTGENNHYTATYAVIIPSSIPADAPNGSLIVSPFYIWTTSIWMEPMPVTGFYRLYGRTYPDRLNPVTIDGVQLIPVTANVAIG